MKCCKKQLYVLSFLLLTQLGIQAQEIYNAVPIAYKPLTIEGSVIQMPIYKNKDIADWSNKYIAAEEKRVKSLYPEYDLLWNNESFNAYSHKEKVTYPIELNFEEETFAAPVDHVMYITSRYGWRRRRAHQGIDIDLVTGDNVRSILAGKVRYARYHSGHGKTVVIRHNNGLESVYAHLSEYDVKENDEVKKGQVIGKGGVSGNARGSHLHLEIRYHGISVNPEYFFDFTKKQSIRAKKIFVTKRWTNPRSHRSTRQSKIVVHESKDHIAQDIEEQKKIYIVKRGDTLSRIARKYHMNISEICRINSIRHNSVLSIGQQIIIY
ncbi:peptidoglycan DD-metalloendopeptidase family protein [Aquimarina hainanensis]|uniref:Peptidoglycan DD-metalloendopeptidase family protein n=1 Tax=Aquimarina hainanensis TaxID=1578017 RepID=A0ABW5NEF9_9FLAO|nr:peptidoglycan DD-metalloendopeptidase family protein [Aquimarina sp. TRL1]